MILKTFYQEFISDQFNYLIKVLIIREAKYLMSQNF